MAFVFSNVRVFVSAPLLLTAGIIFIVTAFPSLKTIFPWVAYLQISAPYRLISKATGQLIQSTNVFKRYLLGILLGFLPCGLVMAALLAVGASPSPLNAAIAMAAFGIGTMPALILVAFGGVTVKHAFPKFSFYFKRGALITSGLWLFFIIGSMIYQAL